MWLKHFLMDGAGDGTGAGQGGAGGTGGAGTGGTGDAAGGGAGAGTGGAGGEGTKTWYTGTVSDAETVGWLQNKGWTDVNGALAAHRSLEKMIGAPADQVLRIPQKGDEAGWRGVYERLGAPKDAAGYKTFGMPADAKVDSKYLGHVAGLFHGAGIPVDAANKIVAGHNEYVAAAEKEAAAAYDAQVTADETALKNEWKGGFDKQMGVAKQAAKLLGFTGQMIDGIERSIGYGNTMKFMVSLAQKLGEDKFVSNTSDGLPGFGLAMTPDQAKQQLQTLSLDKDFTAALLNKDNPGHKAAQEKRTKLYGIAFQE